MALFIGRADFCNGLTNIREVHRDEEEEAGQNTCDRQSKNQKAGSSFREELIFIHGPQCPFILIISNGNEVYTQQAKIVSVQIMFEGTTHGH